MIASTPGDPCLEVDVDYEDPTKYHVIARDTDNGVYFRAEYIYVSLTREQLRAFAQAILAATS
jgi:hypothetical protein